MLSLKELPADVDGGILPKYLILAEHLEQWILNENLPAGTRLPGNRLLAEHFRTTPLTIGKSLNELTRKGLLERRVGAGTFVANSAQVSNRRIGIICHEVICLDTAYISPVIHNFYEYWEQRNCRLISLKGGPKDYERLIQEFELDGIMVLVPRESFFEKIQQIYKSGYPIVSIGFAIPELPEISFGSNHEKAMESAIDYLHSLGHRRIGFIATELKNSSNQIYQRGYAAGMWRNGLPVNPNWHLGANGQKQLVEDLKKIIGQPDSPTAFAITEVSQVLLIYNTLRDLGIRIPEEVSLVGFNDVDYLAELSPPLTVFRQQIEAFTGQAALQLENMMRHLPLMNVDRNQAIPELIERKSCRCILEEGTDGGI